MTEEKYHCLPHGEEKSKYFEHARGEQGEGVVPYVEPLDESTRRKTQIFSTANIQRKED